MLIAFKYQILNRLPLLQQLMVRITIVQNRKLIALDGLNLRYLKLNGYCMKRKVDWDRIHHSIDPSWNLTHQEAEKRLNQFGFNDIQAIKTNPWLILCLSTLQDPMLWFLLITGLLFLCLGNNQEATVLFVALIPLIGMDFFLHYRTESASEHLLHQLTTKAQVVRNNLTLTIPARDIVPGDLVIVNAGSPFPIDGLILSGKHLQVDESVLTGESLPVAKSILKIDAFQQSLPIDEEHWGFAGTKLLTGQAYVRVVYTGQDSFYGQILTQTMAARKSKTPLQLSIAKLVNRLILVATCLCIILANVRLFQGFGWVDALLSAATLAVAALPDEFPVVFTFFLGVGVYRLAQSNTLVRRAASVENLGRITTICTDKTGTLTEGQFKIVQYLLSENMTQESFLESLGMASRMESGDLLDLTILMECTKKGIVSPKILHTIPFTEDRKRETGFIENKDGYWIITKGAPETLLKLCSMNIEEHQNWLKKIEMLAMHGHKVIACASIHMNTLENFNEPLSGYTFLGLVAFKDPLRKGVKEAISECLANGIKVLMITGDHPQTALGIAHDIGMGSQKPPRVILAEELPKFTPQMLRQIDVIARAIPMEKYNIVKQLQSLGEIVAVTGDGINDVPALKTADIGISMGGRGSESAREVSDMILLDDNFSTIVHAIAEGKRLYSNLKACFHYLLLIHIPFVLSAALIPLWGYPLIYTPVEIVFLELIIHPTALLVFQNLPHSPQDKPFQKNIAFFTPKEWGVILIIGLVSTMALMLGYVFNLSQHSWIYARTFSIGLLSLMSFIFAAQVNVFKNLKATLILLGLLGMSLMIFTLPSLAYVFDFALLTQTSWLLLILIASLIGLMYFIAKQALHCHVQPHE